MHVWFTIKKPLELLKARVNVCTYQAINGYSFSITKYLDRQEVEGYEGN